MNRKDLAIYKKTKKYLEKKQDADILKKMKLIETVLCIKNSKDRLSYLYDLICDYLDDKFKNNCLCDFKDGVCVSKRILMNVKKKDTYKNGCCYSYIKKRDCIYLDNDGKCKTKNIACKLFTCSYLRRKGYVFRLNDLYLSKYFFNYRQKDYIENTFYVSKEKIIEEVLKRE